MAVKMFQGAPFGTQTARFDVTGIHPQSKAPGSFTQIAYCKKSTSELQKKLSPGSYGVDVGGFSEKAVQERAQGPGWKRSYETSRMAKIPHLLYREEWIKKKEIKRKLGPGKYNAEKYDFIHSLNSKPCSARGICSTKEQRFRERIVDNPGPGTYGKGGIPTASLEERATKSASAIGLLDSGSSHQRSLPVLGCGLAPGRYEKESFTDRILNKVISKRGPYDLFTGERNKAGKTGHYAILVASDLGPGEYKASSFLDQWEGEHKRKHGQFGKVQQYLDRPTDRVYCNSLAQCPRDPTHPAPNSYSPGQHSATKRNLPPFLSSADRFDRRANKFFTGNVNPVGAGRYEVRKWQEAQHRYGSAHVFNSTQSRFVSSERDFVLKERVQPTGGRLSEQTLVKNPEDQPIKPSSV